MSLPDDPPEAGATPEQRRRARARFLLLLACLALLTVVGWRSGLLGYLREHAAQVRAYVLSLGAWGVLLYAAIYVVSVVAAAPALPFTITAAYIYGTVGGALMAIASATVGATLAFLVARYLGRDFVAGALGGRWKALDEGVRAGGFNYLLSLRLIPVIPFTVLNYGSGLTAMRLRDFVLATLIGITPGAFIYCYAANAAIDVERSRVHLIAALTLLGLMSLAPVAYRRWRGKR